MNRIAVILLAFLACSAAVYADAPLSNRSPAVAVPDTFAVISYGQRVLFFDYTFWNAYVTPGCPPLPETPIMMHGGRALFPLTAWLRMGLEGYGISHGVYTGSNITEVAGAYAAIVTDFRWKALDFLHLTAGLNISCGRFWFTSMTKAGTGLRASSGSVSVIPHAGFSLSLFDKMELSVAASTILPMLIEDRIWQGPGTPQYVRPAGLGVEVALGLYLPVYQGD